MKHLKTLIVLLFTPLVIFGQSKYVKDSYATIILSDESLMVKNATIDLQRYLTQVRQEAVTVANFDAWRENPQPAIVIGEFKQLKKYFPSLRAKNKLEREGYVIHIAGYKGKQCIVLAAEQPLGMVNSIYGFLKESGFEFNLASEVIPGYLPDYAGFSNFEKKPIFNVRGVLPWYNFFNSPTTWDKPDHRAFVDQLIRSGANFITFHSYEHEPFAAVRENGRMIFGEGLRNTSVPTWGTNAMPASEYMFGTNKLFDTPYFGAETTLMGYDASTQIEKEKEIMRDALLYAKNRGLSTSMGFAAYGDPTLKEDRERFIKEFTYNLEYFNFLDYIFLWQTETKGAQGHPLQYDQHILPDHRDPDSKIINYGHYRRDDFKRIVDKESGIKPFFKPDEDGKIARATEGARLEMFAKTALRILSRYENPPKIVIAGWGGQNYLLSEEYYDGLDKLLPDDVAFSSLESLSPKSYIDRAYFDLPQKRQRWPIPWLENDGDQWHPQPFLKIFEPMAKELEESGSQGFLSIHWRTREVEDNFGYLLDYSWAPRVTKEEFFSKKAKKYVGISDELEEIYFQLDSLGYRWVGGRGQNECAVFTWGSGKIAHYEVLFNLRERLEALLPKVEQDKDNLIWLRDRMDWVLDYQNAEMQAEEAARLLKQAAQAEGDEKQQYAKRAFGILSGDALAKAMQSYAERISTRGEYGVMATINTKAAYDWRRMYNEASAILEISIPMREEWNPEPRIIIPRMYGSCEAGKDFEMKVIVLGGKQATLQYRRLGQKNWNTLPMRTTQGWVQQVIIPGREIKNPGFEFQISLAGEPAQTIGPKAVSVIPADNNYPVITKKTEVKESLKKISVAQEKGFSVLKWNEITGTDYYEVSVNGVLEVETPVNFYPFADKPSKGAGIVVKAIKDKKVISEIACKY